MSIVQVHGSLLNWEKVDAPIRVVAKLSMSSDVINGSTNPWFPNGVDEIILVNFDFQIT